LGWCVPPELAGFRWLSSPLRRALETAERLGVQDFAVEPCLTEMDWGDWEGQTLIDLRRNSGYQMTENEAAGLDFRPSRGESPRDVQARLKPLLTELGRAGHPTAAITHKGVIRAVYALAAGWDMRGKPPNRLSSAAAHVFRLDVEGRPSVERLNISMTAA
jgi:probable phosphoglycerate mutase